jgi:hypothetical protein
MTKDRTHQEQDSSPSETNLRLEHRKRALRAARAVVMAGALAAMAACGGRAVGSDARADGGDARTDGGIADVTLQKDQKTDTWNCFKEWRPGCPQVGPGVPPEMPV